MTYEFDFDTEETILVKDKSAAKRRHNNVKKAIRKQNISKHVYGINWYHNLHQYSKNKIHCSCNLCRFRPVWHPNARTYSDMKKDISTNDKLLEYMSA